jgi:hypothetical protein
MLEAEFFEAGFLFGVIWINFVFLWLITIFDWYKLRRLRRFINEEGLADRFYRFYKGGVRK